jgi:hypothetical protein
MAASRSLEEEETLIFESTHPAEFVAGRTNLQLKNQRNGGF